MSLSLCITCCDLDLHLLDGLLNQFRTQTEAPNEIIISSSGVESSLLEKYKNWEIRDQHIPIKITNQKERRVQSAARNAGAAIAKSDYVMFFDVDDIPHPQKIELCKLHIQGYDFLLHNYQINNSKFKPLDSLNINCYYNFRMHPTCTNLIIDNRLPICHGHLTIKSKIFKSLTYQQLSLGQKETGEDGKFCQDLVANGYKGIFINAPLISYTQR